MRTTTEKELYHDGFRIGARRYDRGRRPEQVIRELPGRIQAPVAQGIVDGFRVTAQLRRKMTR